MGESAMLLRSFSHPSNASREDRVGDPIRALTESISFGRFVSEPLAWEKWSTFSHNRYLEEVEKFSKPGSVAEKKAYFEAHYKRKAAMKAAACEEGNSAANDGAELKTTCDIHNDSPMDAESTKANSHVTINKQEQHIPNTENDSSTDIELARKSNVTIDEQWQNDATYSEVADSADENACNSINVRNDSENADLERDMPVIEYAINVENSTKADNLKQLQNANVLDKIVAARVENKLDKEAVDQEILSTSIKKKRSSWSFKSSTQSRASQLASCSSKQAPSLPPRNVDNITVNCKKSVGGSNEKKRVVPKTVHMSINFSSHASEASRGSLKKPEDCSTPIQTPIRASINGVSKHLSKIFQSENKSGSKSPRTNGSKPRSPNISSPFSFRSEERAAKRREFFQKLEEKSDAKESESTLVDRRSKGKAEHDIKKLRQNTSVGAKQNDHFCCGSNMPSNRLKKIPFTQPRSPKLGGKPTPAAVPYTSSRPPRRPSSNTEGSKHDIKRTDRSTTPSVTSLPKLVRKQSANTVQDASSRPPWRSSMSAASFKRVMEKSNRSTTLSVTSLPKKNSHENASPNIQC